MKKCRWCKEPIQLVQGTFGTTWYHVKRSGARPRYYCRINAWPEGAPAGRSFAVPEEFKLGPLSPAGKEAI